MDDLTLPAGRFARFLQGRGLPVERVLAFAGLSTLAVVGTDVLDGADAPFGVAKGLSGYYHVIEGIEDRERPGAYGYYWYKRFDGAQHRTWEAAFRFEYDTLHALRDSAGVVDVWAADLDAEIPYYVMRHHERGSLSAVAGARGWDLPATFVLDVVSGIGTGLSALHGLGRVHRDLNAENVLITDEGGAVIADLGCARALHAPPTGPRTRPDELHWPPEYAESYDTAGVEADVYALGVLIHQMTVGRMPRYLAPGCTAAAPPGRYPKALTVVADACLEHEPRNRPGSVEEALRDVFGG